MIDPAHVIMLRAALKPSVFRAHDLTWQVVRLKLLRAQQCADNTQLPKVEEKLLNYIKEVQHD